jgi:predicted DNA-binding transcriptional regulator AlpA
MIDTLLSPTALADYLDVPVATVYRWNYVGSGPPVLHIGRHVRYRSGDVQKWLGQQTTGQAQTS